VTSSMSANTGNRCAVAFGCRDLFATAAAMRERALPILPIPTNYYEDLEARRELDPALLKAMRRFGILYDRGEAGGELFHLYTGMLGHRLFLEVVQRVGGCDGYGEVNAPVRSWAATRGWGWGRLACTLMKACEDWEVCRQMC
jgi:4-hydroxyphenylpyruvate dioxygenase